MGGTSEVTSQTLVGGANNRVNMRLGVYQDTDIGSSGTPVSTLTATGLYASNFTYTFPTDGNATEEVTLKGNDKVWTAGGSAVFSTALQSKGTARRWKFDTANCVFPTGEGGMYDAVLSNVTVSMDLGREAIYTLGSYQPYLRYVNFPVEITTEITSIGTDGDYLDVSASQYSCTGTTNIVPKEIVFAICGSGNGDSLTINLGTNNRLQSVNYTGGDTGGGNVEISYSFTTNNEFTMTAAGTYALAAASGS